MATAADIQRLRGSTTDNVLFDHFTQQDAGFKQAVDRVKSKNPNMGVLEQAKFPSAMLDLYYKVPKKTTMNPMTTQMASALGESSQPVTPEDQQPASFGGFAKNVVKSGVDLIANTGSAIIHPIKTISFLGNSAVGGVINAIDKITGSDFQGTPEQMQDAAAVGDFVKQRYGSIDALKHTAYSDPVGFLADIASVLTAGGGALAKVGDLGKLAGAGSRIADVAEVAGKAGATVAAAGDAINPLGVAGKMAGKMLTKGGKEVASQFSGLDRGTLEQLPTEAYAGAKAGEITPQSLAGSVDEAIAAKTATLDEASAAYQPIRAAQGEVSLLKKDLGGHAIQKVLENNGLSMDENGKLLRTLDTKSMKPGDVTRIQDFIDLLKDPETGKLRSKITPAQFLNARQNSGLLADYEAGSTNAAARIGNEIYQSLNDTGRPQIPGLEELDKVISPQINELKGLRKEFLVKNAEGNYEIKPGAISKIMSATGKYKDAQLHRLEGLVPGITEKIHAIHALQDVTSGGMKVGTYFRGALGGGSVITGNIPGMFASLITSPRVLEGILMKAGQFTRSQIGQIIGKVIAGIPLNAAEVRSVSAAIEAENNQSESNQQTDQGTQQ